MIATAISALMLSVLHLVYFDKKNNIKNEIWKKLLEKIDVGVLLLDGEEVRFANSALFQIMEISSPVSVTPGNKKHSEGINEKTANQIINTLKYINLPEELPLMTEMKSGRHLEGSLFELFFDYYPEEQTSFEGQAFYEIKTLKYRCSTLERGKSQIKVITFSDITKLVHTESNFNKLHQDSIMIASSSHEIRNLLNGILNMLELMSPDVPEKIQEYHTLAFNSSHFLLNVVNDLLDLVQVGERKLRLHHEFFDPKNTVRETII